MSHVPINRSALRDMAEIAAERNGLVRLSASILLSLLDTLDASESALACYHAGAESSGPRVPQSPSVPPASQDRKRTAARRTKPTRT